MRPADLQSVKDHAERFGSNGLEITTAMRLHFEDASDRKKRAAIKRARKLYPVPYPRRGRGNRVATS